MFLFCSLILWQPRQSRQRLKRLWDQMVSLSYQTVQTVILKVKHLCLKLYVIIAFRELELAVRIPIFNTYFSCAFFFLFTFSMQVLIK